MCAAGFSRPSLARRGLVRACRLLSRGSRWMCGSHSASNLKSYDNLERVGLLRLVVSLAYSGEWKTMGDEFARVQDATPYQFERLTRVVGSA
jgi:hypothetical protein